MAEQGNVTVTFDILGEGFKHTIDVPASTQFGQLKVELAAALSISTDSISLRVGDSSTEDTVSLEQLGHTTSVVVQAELSVALPPLAEEKEYRMPDEIDVTVDFENGQQPRTIKVQIVRDLSKKRYLGGFRNRKTSLVYHHGSTQTIPERKDYGDVSNKNHRETQTYITKTRAQQTTRENGTQMSRPDLYMDDSADRQVAARKYFNSSMLGELRLRKTVVIQCYWRGYVARKRAWNLRERLFVKQEEAQEAERNRKLEAEARHKQEIERRMHPRTFDDFEILYNELENWRQHETQRINTAGMDERERLAALAQLLHKETKLLQTIDRLKLSANKENREQRIKSVLELMAAPKKWQMSDGEVAEVHTPFTTRAKELLELHRGLDLPKLTIDERLDVLLHVKWTVKEFDCNLTREIVDLIDREADLLNRGRSEDSLGGLRKRITNLFLQFIETPEFNPESARFQKVPRDLMMRQNVQPIGAATHGLS